MIERIFFGQHYSFIFHPVYMYVRYRSMTLSDTCTIRRSWTLHPVPGLPVVAWGERGNILLARSFHAAHYDRDSCEMSAWKYRGNIVRWMWILQRFNEERNPFLVCGKTWLIITFCCVYCSQQSGYWFQSPTLVRHWLASNLTSMILIGKKIIWSTVKVGAVGTKSVL